MSPSSGVFWKDGRKARDACLQYLKDVPNKCAQEGYYTGLSRYLNEELKCHIFSIWGIGGAPPPDAEPPSENPYEALLGFGNDLETAVWLTAGAIVSEKFILTSAHGNTKTSGDLPLKYAALGVKNRKGDKKDWQIHTVKKIYEHPQFNNRYNDIALIELQEPITFNNDVLPACLPEPAEEFDITNAKFSSWKDKTADVNSFLDTSIIVNVEELAAAECDAKITSLDGHILASYNKLLPEKVKDESQLCYGNKDSCLNIVGGPLAVTTQYSRCMNTVVGVNAFGDSCGPAVFTKVEHYTPWIESIVWP
ncbi:unnamed protein product [Arctia plantaginis]|uniref:Peptidase S1 domain-containing protein n=1 Tax=Arctia plantaginis TaxID=874455 RepID=A0A8S1BKH7_ARCPL|nr:unnamed protein product [Arctia plantaginis]